MCLFMQKNSQWNLWSICLCTAVKYHLSTEWFHSAWTTLWWYPSDCEEMTLLNRKSLHVCGPRISVPYCTEFIVLCWQPVTEDFNIHHYLYDLSAGLSSALFQLHFFLLKFFSSTSPKGQWGCDGNFRNEKTKPSLHIYFPFYFHLISI